MRPIIASIIMGAIAYGVYQGLYYLSGINIISLAASVIAGCIFYFILIIRWKAVSEDELRSMPKGQLLIRIAKKTGIMKEENRQKKRKRSAKRKNNKKKKKNIGKEKRENRENRENREETDDYWLDE